MSPTYAGIGARQSPRHVLTGMTEIAADYRQGGWTLRTGHAPGADQAFERGAGENAEHYKPWADYENRVPALGVVMNEPTEHAYTLAAQFHPNWPACSRGARALLARNLHILLGPTLDDPDAYDPVACVWCWTFHGRATGGTGHAIRAARAHDILVFDLGTPGWTRWLNTRQVAA